MICMFPPNFGNTLLLECVIMTCLLPWVWLLARYDVSNEHALTYPPVPAI